MKGDKSTQIRGGTGLFVSRIPEVLVSNQLGNNGVNTAVINVTNTRAYPFVTNPSQLPVAVQPVIDPTKLLQTIQNLPPYTINASDADLKYPQIWKTNIAIDQRLPWGLIGTAEFIYNKTLNGLRYIDANLKAPDRALTGPDTRVRFPASGVTSTGTGAANTVNIARFYNPAIQNAFVLKNTNQGNSYIATIKLEKPASRGFGGFVSYTYGEAKDIAFVGSTVQANVPTTIGQNYLPLTYSDNDLRHRIVGLLNYRLNYGGKVGGSSTFTLGLVSNSGSKISYTLNQDLNGDGQTTNDLIFVPNKASDLTFLPLVVNTTATATTPASSVTYSPEQQQTAFDAYINGNDYLKTRRGQYAERNGGAFPWLTRVNSWGAGNQTTTFNPIAFSGTINAAGVPSYRLATQQITEAVNGVNVSRTVLLRDSFIPNVSVNAVWQAQFGLRYIFN